jgi:cytochrome c553
MPLALAAQTAIPKAWNEDALRAMTVPRVGLNAPVKYAPADWYYRIPERTIYRVFPVYAPDKEPKNYMNFVAAQAPEIAFDASKVSAEADWALAGETVFSSVDTTSFLTPDDMHNPDVWEKFHFKADAEGALPGWRYVVRKKGLVEVGQALCGSCHEGMVDGITVAGVAGKPALGALDAFSLRRELNAARDRDATGRVEVARLFALFSVPWQKPDPADQVERLSIAQVLAVYDAQPPEVVAPVGTSLFFPPRIPDLIGIKGRNYLGATGAYHHSDTSDLMRYAALEAGMDRYTQYGDFRAAGELPDPSKLTRLSDAQLYALAVFLYAMKPPANPNRLDTSAKHGQKIFEREGCADCHPAPLYTNGRLSPAQGFHPAPKAAQKYGIMRDSVGTDPRLAMETRSGTGCYRVPSLIGVWYREPFEHDGSLAMLEDLFDPMRVRAGYVPTGFKGIGIETRPVKGHEFALNLSFEERRALMAFLRTL